MIFDERKFVRTGMLDAVGKMPDYWVVNTAMGWLEKGVLHEEDLAEIQSRIDANSADAKLTEEESEESQT